LQALRRAVERDRYGLVAHVLVVRDHCQPSNCAAFQSLSDHNQVAGNMEERTYEKLVARYALSWGAPAATADAAGVRGTSSMPAPASMPTGKPTTIDLPTSESIPPVSIMTPEPSTGATPPAPASSSAQTVPKPRPSSARKPPPKAHVAAPVRLTPEPSSANTQN
jgi:hypothetical protein